MSSVIKMDVPESCAACKLSYLKEQPEGHYDRMCPLLQHEVSDYDETCPEDCWFMEQLPREHGPLIDADELIKSFTGTQEEIASYKAEDELIAELTENIAVIVRDSIRSAPIIVGARESQREASETDKYRCTVCKRWIEDEEDALIIDAMSVTGKKSGSLALCSDCMDKAIEECE